MSWAELTCMKDELKENSDNPVNWNPDKQKASHRVKHGRQAWNYVPRFQFCLRVEFKKGNKSVLPDSQVIILKLGGFEK